MTDDFTIIYQDALRLKTAILVMAGEHKNNTVLWNKIHAAIILLERCETANQLEYACGNLRQIFAVLNDQELEYEREVPDPAQSLGGASVRHSPQTRDDRAEWRRNVDSVDERAPGVSDPMVGTEQPIPNATDGRSDEHDQGVARPLQPQQKRHRAIRRKTKDRLRRTPVEYHSEVKKVD